MVAKGGIRVFYLVGVPRRSDPLRVCPTTVFGMDLCRITLFHFFSSERLYHDGGASNAVELILNAMDFPGSLARSVTPESEENRSQNGAVDAPNEPNLRRGAPLPPLSHLSQIPAIASSIHGKNAFFTEEDLPGCLQDLNAAGGCLSNEGQPKASAHLASLDCPSAPRS